MTALTLRRIRGEFVVTGPDIEPMRFKPRPEARDSCKAHYPARRSLRSVGVRRGGDSGGEGEVLEGGVRAWIGRSRLG